MPTWTNYLVFSIDASAEQGHLPADHLRKSIEQHHGGEAYHCAYDLEARPTFKSYSGLMRPALGYVWFDFDSTDGGVLALEDAKKFIAFLQVTDVLTCYSGSKGFHVGVPFSYFPFQESVDLGKKLLNMAHALKKLFPTLDTTVYNANRKFRALGSKHPKTGLYKCQLRDLSLPLEAIREQAKERGNLVIPIPIVHAAPLSQLAALDKPFAQDSVGMTDEQYFSQFESFANKACVHELYKRRCAPGGRHKTLLILASEYFHTGKHIDETISLLKAWAEKNHLEAGRFENETLKFVQEIYSGQLKLSYGCQTPDKAQLCSAKCPLFRKISPEKRPTPLDAPLAAVKELTSAKKPREFDIASQLFRSFEGTLCRQEKSLFKYTGTHWIEITHGQTLSIKNGIMEMTGGMLNSKQIDSIYATFIRMLPCVPDGISLFDPHPFCVNFKNGTLHAIQSSDYTYSLEFKPHRKEDYLNTVLQFDYSADSHEQNIPFLDMLERIFMGDADQNEKIMAVRQMYGACLLPAFPRFFFIHGKAGTGKSSLILLAGKLVSEVNTCSVEPHEFDGFNMESMIGKLVNLETDVTTTAPISDAAIKKVIDRRKFRIRRKGIADIYGMLPVIHIFGGNKIPPTLEGDSRAHDRRWTFIECPNYMIETGNYNKEFHNWVFEQSPQGILNFALEGLKDLLAARGHYLNPASGKASLEDWQTQGDSVALFLKDVESEEVFSVIEQDKVQLHKVETGKINRVKLYEIYSKWFEETGGRDLQWSKTSAPLLTRNSFYTALKNKGFHVTMSHGVRRVNGFSLGAPKGAEF